MFLSWEPYHPHLFYPVALCLFALPFLAYQRNYLRALEEISGWIMSWLLLGGGKHPVEHFTDTETRNNKVACEALSWLLV